MHFTNWYFCLWLFFVLFSFVRHLFEIGGSGAGCLTWSGWKSFVCRQLIFYFIIVFINTLLSINTNVDTHRRSSSDVGIGVWNIYVYRQSGQSVIRRASANHGHRGVLINTIRFSWLLPHTLTPRYCCNCKRHLLDCNFELHGFFFVAFFRMQCNAKSIHFVYCHFNWYIIWLGRFLKRTKRIEINRLCRLINDLLGGIWHFKTEHKNIILYELSSKHQI